jgi:hypothetical protein
MDIDRHAALPFPRSLPEFQRLFPNDAACAEYLEKLRWRGGFVCPRCGVTAQDKRRDGRYAGRVRLAVAADRSAKSLCGFVAGAVAPGTLIVTDDWSGYAGLRKRGYDHHAIAECGDPEVTEEFLPIIHLVFANLKTWLVGIHHAVSAQHLQAYLNEFTFRFNRRFYPLNAFRSLLGIAGAVTAPTYAELYSRRQGPPYV